MSISIRRAEVSDIPWIIEELNQFSKSLPLKKSLISDDVEYLKVGLTKIIEEHLMLISYNENSRTGLIAGLITPHFFNPKLLTLCELFWWVNPAFRNGRSGLKLLDAFTKCSKHVDMIDMAIETESPISDKCLLKRGYKKTETHYIRES